MSRNADFGQSPPGRSHYEERYGNDSVILNPNRLSRRMQATSSSGLRLRIQRASGAEFFPGAAFDGVAVVGQEVPGPIRRNKHLHRSMTNWEILKPRDKRFEALKLNKIQAQHYNHAHFSQRQPQKQAVYSSGSDISLARAPSTISTFPMDNRYRNSYGSSQYSISAEPYYPGERGHFATGSEAGLSWRRLHMSRAKLKATATTSELLSGFAMVAMVELQINEPTNVPEWLFIMFSVCTTVLVAVHIFALMISTYLLPNIDAISKLHSPKLVDESPHERMKGFVELAWAFSTVLGLFLFLVEVAILCWVKFWDFSFKAAMAATTIVIPVLVIFIAFVFHFYRSLVVYKFKATVMDINELEEMKKKLDNVSMA